MRFGPSDDQQALADAVSSLVARRAAVTGLRDAIDAGYDRELWRTLGAQIGAAGLAIPEEYGGAGFTALETHVVLERLGAGLTPSPLFGSAVLGAGALLECAGPDERARLLPPIAAGTTIAALAWADARGRHRTDGPDVHATPTTSGWSLSGTATLVLDATDAGLLLVVASVPAGLGLFEVDPAAVTVTPTPALDPTLRFASVTLDRAPATLLGADAGAGLARLHDRAATAITALQVGACRAALDRTVAHLRTRTQFDRPLGSFQALKHRAAEMLVRVETARSMSWAAAWAAAYDPADLPFRAALAKAWCSDAFTYVTAEMVQLHGGTAITWEHDAHLYFKRAHATAQLFGTARDHRRRILTETA
ncbi:acyl-CoA dehydrogenase family protein [Cryptosporangium phraense]|uniref:Acyl-CoA dehydrogenase n=1 Tax=Cryptosporangium phraense TaxID=2593070 RepID=A0A545ATN5_9ACTN|nr:acyl-CoA dehydrogenase family protein [Cryptosporangium phraense]TQS44699.1 acyl-CoA dehydrogenase [Cryptosporangium phraense]